MLSDPHGQALFRAMISEAQRFPKIASTFFAAGPQTMIRMLRDNIVHWQKEGLLRSGDAEMLAVQFLGLMMGNLHLKSLLGLMDPMTDKQIKAWVARGVDVFLDGMFASQRLGFKAMDSGYCSARAVCPVWIAVLSGARPDYHDDIRKVLKPRARVEWAA